MRGKAATVFPPSGIYERAYTDQLGLIPKGGWGETKSDNNASIWKVGSTMVCRRVPSSITDDEEELTHMYTDAYIHMHTYIHACVHTYTHT